MSGVVAGLLGAIVLLAGSASAEPLAPPLGTDATAQSRATVAKRGALRLQHVDGGPGYWGRFSNALPRTPNYFPVGVWLESALDRGDIRMDKDAGLNTYVALTSNSSLALARRNGMKVLLQQDEWLRKSPPGRETAGWLLRDEIDMQMSPDAGYAELLRLKGALPSDRRMRYNNFGKGVLFWLRDAQAARYVNAVDLPSTDVYWFSDGNACGFSEGGRLLAGGRRSLSSSECHRASNYGAQVRRVRNLVSPARSKPVWTFVEVGHPFSDADSPGITPPQIRAAVWHSIIAGARGITYFNHSFGGPCRTQHVLREPCYARARAVVKTTNRQVKSLAPVLNAPFVVAGWTHSRSTEAMVKWHRGRFYVFAGSAENASSTGSFSIPCVGDAKATVVGENRTISIRRGSFTDSFADGNAIHIYRIEARRGCRLTRPS
jgi:hypothetical protein